MLWRPMGFLLAALQRQTCQVILPHNKVEEGCLGRLAALSKALDFFRAAPESEPEASVQGVSEELGFPFPAPQHQGAIGRAEEEAESDLI